MKNIILASVIVIGCATRGNGTATILGYLSMLGVDALALGSNKLIDACTVRRAA